MEREEIEEEEEEEEREKGLKSRYDSVVRMRCANVVFLFNFFLSSLQYLQLSEIS